MSTQTTRLEELGRELGRAIVDHPRYEAYEEAKVAVEADDDTREPITEFSQLREEFNVSRQMNEATQEGLWKVQTAQEELHSESVTEEHLLVQAEPAGELEKINEAISELLAVDFGGETNGYCNG